MKFSIISLFPEMIKEAIKVGVIGQAVGQDLIKVDVYNPRSWTQDIHKTVDDRPFGGGDGMVLMAEPLTQCLDSILEEEKKLKQASPRFIYLSPQGKTLNHSLVMELSQEKHLLLLCGRYAGVDQRLLNHYHFEEISIGDYVLSGGELGALVLVDSIGRQLEGVLGHKSSSLEDSFARDGLLEAPCFTRPRKWNEQEVPEFLLSGNHAQIAEDRWLLGVLVTFIKRPDLFKRYIEEMSISSQNLGRLSTTSIPKINVKVWRRAFLRLKQESNQTLTTLGFSRRNLEEFEIQLQANKIL